MRFQGNLMRSEFGKLEPFPAGQSVTCLSYSSRVSLERWAPSPLVPHAGFPLLQLWFSHFSQGFGFLCYCIKPRHAQLPLRQTLQAQEPAEQHAAAFAIILTATWQQQNQSGHRSSGKKTAAVRTELCCTLLPLSCCGPAEISRPPLLAQLCWQEVVTVSHWARFQSQPRSACGVRGSPPTTSPPCAPPWPPWGRCGRGCGHRSPAWGRAGGPGWGRNGWRCGPHRSPPEKACAGARRGTRPASCPRARWSAAHAGAAGGWAACAAHWSQRAASWAGWAHTPPRAAAAGSWTRSRGSWGSAGAAAREAGCRACCCPGRGCRAASARTRPAAVLESCWSLVPESAGSAAAPAQEGVVPGCCCSGTTWPVPWRSRCAGAASAAVCRSDPPFCPRASPPGPPGGTSGTHRRAQKRQWLSGCCPSRVLLCSETEGWGRPWLPPAARWPGGNSVCPI